MGPLFSFFCTIIAEDVIPFIEILSGEFVGLLKF